MCIGLQIRSGYYNLSYFLCTSVTEKPGVRMAPFLTPSTCDIKLNESFSLLNFSSLSLLLSSCGSLGYFKMSHSVLKCNLMWAGCYQHISVKCNKFGRANISKTSFDLMLDAIQIPHPDKSNKNFFDSPNTIQLPIQDRSLHHRNSL